MSGQSFTWLRSIALKYDGECGLLAVGRDDRLYVEEIYGEDYWGAQHILTPTGEFLHTEDEDHGKQAVTPVEIPHDAYKPQAGWHTNHLNFAGPRHRGLRATERVADTVHALPLPLKMRLVEKLGLSIMPPHLLGMAESYVVSEAMLERPYRFVICRRVRFAYALPTPQTDADGQPYDYDNVVVHIAQVHHTQADDMDDIAAGLDDFYGVALNHPTDCVIVDDRLYMADCGMGQRQSQVHIWQIARE